MLCPTREGGKLRDCDNLELLTANPHDISDGFAEKGLCNWRSKRDRTGLWVGFVFSNDAIFLHATIGPGEGNRAPESDDVVRSRIRNQLGCPQALGKVARVPQGDGRQAPPFIDVFGLLCGLIRLANLPKLKLQRFQSRLCHQIGI